MNKQSSRCGLCAQIARHSALIDAEDEPAAWPDGTVSGGYRFRHEMVHQVAYERLAVAQRVALHRRIGLSLEAVCGTGQLFYALSG